MGKGDFQGLYRSVLIFGPPGSGKGTMGKFLSHVSEHYHLSSGDIFRSLNPDSKGGKLFTEYAGKGRLVPDEVTIEIWKEHMEKLVDQGDFDVEKQLLLLDGIPRTENQVKLMAPYIDLKAVIVLQMPDTERLISRMRKRAIIENRLDDQDEEVLRTRIEVYQKQTAGLLALLPKDRIHVFNADQSKIYVLRDILDRLGSLLA